MCRGGPLSGLVIVEKFGDGWNVVFAGSADGVFGFPRLLLFHSAKANNNLGKFHTPKMLGLFFAPWVSAIPFFSEN